MSQTNSIILVACVTLVELEVAIKALISVFQTCADELLKVGAGVAVDVDAKASIAACVAATITVSLLSISTHVCKLKVCCRRAALRSSLRSVVGQVRSRRGS